MRRFLIAMVLVGSASFLLAAQSATDAGHAKNNDSAATSTSKQTYLGVSAEAISPALASQLSDVVPLGQVVLVADVVKDSPAAKAGLKSHDILLSLGDQKLYSPEQLAKLVHADKPNRRCMRSCSRWRQRRRPDHHADFVRQDAEAGAAWRPGRESLVVWSALAQ
ncbi:MAG TPA: PDZ domain-containing protein [Gemmataceae bacterium]|jgi:membrane-associated protease RseP (regulator of RpoE activity)|nr:PDZ domain-containing protein [Gemmataceae bacterium]